MEKKFWRKEGGNTEIDTGEERLYGYPIHKDGEKVKCYP